MIHLFTEPTVPRLWIFTWPHSSIHVLPPTQVPPALS